MIEADVPFEALAKRLAARAASLAVAHTAARLLAARGDERRWRHAGLVWPLFAKG